MGAITILPKRATIAGMIILFCFTSIDASKSHKNYRSSAGKFSNQIRANLNSEEGTLLLESIIPSEIKPKFVMQRCLS